MQIHQLKPAHKVKKKKRVGRGGKHGTYSGRGQKGQKSRAGRKFVPIIRSLIKKYPKLKGYRSKRREKNLVTVNIGVLNDRFKDSEIISPKTLIERKIIRRIRGKTPKIKILGQGKLIKSLNVQDCELSKSAKEAIKKAKGVIKQ